MRKAIFSLAIVSLMLMAVFQGNVHSAEIICPDIADLYIDEWKPDENLNYEDLVKVATNTNRHHGIARALLLFAFPEDLRAFDIKGAKIYLSACSACGGGKGGQVAFYALNQPFDEDADTWNSLGGGNWDDSVFSRATLPAGRQWNDAVEGEPPADAVGFDVTELLRRRLDKVKKYGMLLRFYDEHQKPYTHQAIASRESDNPLDFAPFIKITTRDNEPCPAEIIFAGRAEAIASLRQFRDQVLAKSPAGRYIIALYYRSAPFLSSALTDNPSLKAGARMAADALIPRMIRLF